MKFRHNILLLSIVILSYSCSPQIYFLEANKIEKITENHQGEVAITADFAGDAIDYIIFELTIENNSTDTFFIRNEDITLNLSEEETSSQRPIFPLEKDFLLERIENRKDENRVRKKHRTLNLVLGGLDILTTLLSPGLSAGNRLLYAIEPAVYMADGQRSSKLVERSIDEQIQYVEDWAFDDTFILPGAEGSWDILFESVLINGSAELNIQNVQVDFLEKFDLYIDILE